MKRIGVLVLPRIYNAGEGLTPNFNNKNQINYKIVTFLKTIRN